MDRLLAQPNQRYYGPHRDYLYMRLMLKAELRASDATALRPEHVDLMSGKLSVREGKGAKDCSLWVGEEVLGELQEWMARRPLVRPARSRKVLVDRRADPWDKGSKAHRRIPQLQPEEKSMRLRTSSIL